MWLWIMVLVAVIGAIAIVAAGRGDAMVEVYDDRPDATLPTGGPLTAADLAAVRFSTTVRGYRMDEVDALLARVQEDLLARQPVAEAADVDAVDVDVEVARRPSTQPPPSGASAATPST